MKLNVKQKILDISGKVAEDLIDLGNGKSEKRTYTYGERITNALLNAHLLGGQRPESLSTEENTKRFLLAIKLTRAVEDESPGVVDLPSADQELIKKCIALCYGPLVVRQIVAALDQKNPYTVEDEIKAE